MGAAPPKTRNLLSTALPIYLFARAPLLFWWVWRQLAAHPTSEPTAKPQTTSHSSATDPEPSWNPPYTAWEIERNPHEPTGNPAKTWESERNPRGAHRAHREPTGNHLKERGAHFPPTGVYNTFHSEERDAVGNIESLSCFCTTAVPQGNWQLAQGISE